MMERLQYWQPGDKVVLRGVSRDRIWWACGATVVQDSSDMVVLYWPAGTPNRRPDKRMRARDLLSGDVRLIPGNWVSTDVLAIAPNQSAHMIYVMWEAGTPKFLCWYVNLQEPLRRTTLGFDTNDHLLDIVITPDRSEWYWKDEDELEEAAVLGVFSPEEIRTIRAEGEKVISDLQANRSPFCDGWENWRPPAEWQVSVLPDDWDRITSGLD